VRRHRAIYFLLISFVFASQSLVAKGSTTPSFEIYWDVSTGDPIPEWSQVPMIIESKGLSTGLAVVMPKCDPSISGDCIRGVEIESSPGVWAAGKLVSYLPVDEDIATFPGKTSYRLSETISPQRALGSAELPVLARSSIWRFPGVSHSNGLDFMVTAVVRTGVSGGKLTPSTAPFNIVITPISLTKLPITPLELSERMSYPVLIDGLDEKTRCFYVPDQLAKVCISREEFKNFSPFRVTINLDKLRNIFQWNSWFYSRTEQSAIGFSRTRQGNSLVTFEGKPIWVNSASLALPWNVENYKLGRKINNSVWTTIEGKKNHSFRVDESDLRCYREPTEPIDWQTCPPVGNIFSAFSAEDTFAHLVWREIEQYAELKPGPRISMWSFRKANPMGKDFFRMQECSLDNQPSGLIASNATSLLPAAPLWNESNRSLDFSLASTHRDVANQVVSGYYGLSLAKDVATCLWQGDISNIEANIEILSSSSQEKISVQATSAILRNGYFNFNASGFTYSAKDIRVKILTKTAPSTKVSVEPRVSAPKKAAKKSMKCKKGKQVKVVVAVEPRCPPGFKQA
jgi:hypothetical protein